MELPPSVEVTTGKQPDAAVIWLHGLGADGHDFEPVVEQLALPGDLAIRFVFPHAPARPVTLNDGMVMPSWFDIHGLDFDARQDEAGIREAARAVDGLLARQAAHGIPYKRMILAGFSQGGAVALHAGLRREQPLGGLMALSTFLPLATMLAAEHTPASLVTSLFMAHGRDDPVVAFDYGRRSRDRLEAFGYSIVWQEYAMAHGVIPEEIRDIRTWLVNLLS